MKRQTSSHNKVQPKPKTIKADPLDQMTSSGRGDTERARLSKDVKVPETNFWEEDVNDIHKQPSLHFKPRLSSKDNPLMKKDSNPITSFSEEIPIKKLKKKDNAES